MKTVFACIGATYVFFKTLDFGIHRSNEFEKIQKNGVANKKILEDELARVDAILPLVSDKHDFLSWWSHTQILKCYRKELVREIYTVSGVSLHNLLVAEYEDSDKIIRNARAYVYWVSDLDGDVDEIMNSEGDKSDS